MSGLRDMSIIATPPSGPAGHPDLRHQVRSADRSARRSLREIQRGGQVFFVHNRVQSIHSMEKFLRELVPEATIGVAHGQMGEGQLEKAMADFVDRKFQVLLSTTIIESGIDIASANTMIVNRADTFGLAQLYQLRGRVGRSKERAYAYLLVPARRAVTRDAQRRLEVLQAFTELGAGFSHRLARSGDPRRGQPARARPVGHHRRDRLRPVHPAAGGGGGGDAGRAAAGGDRAGGHAAHPGADPRRLRAGRAPAAGALQAVQRRRVGGRGERSARRAGRSVRRAARTRWTR